MSTERIYPCERCGKQRTKAEGGTTFTVCDECWEIAYPKAASATPEAQEDPIGLVVDLIREHEAQANPNAWETAGRIVARLFPSGKP